MQLSEQHSCEDRLKDPLFKDALIAQPSTSTLQHIASDVSCPARGA